MRDYKLISGDSHVVEPPDVWEGRGLAKYKDRAPHMVYMEHGDGWIMEGTDEPLPFGLVQCAGLGPENYLTWVKWDSVRPLVYEPGPRLLAQDQGDTDAEVLYPSPRIGNNLFTTNADAEFHVAMIRAYNDWLSDFCSHAPDRLIGLALMPTLGVGSALEEMRRTMKLPGLRGVVLGRYPTGEMAVTLEDDPFWAEAEASGTPVNIHVSLAGQQMGAAKTPFFGAFTGALRFSDASHRCQELIYNKVFDRFPKLNAVFAEVDAGWIPYVKEQLDDRYSRQNKATRPEFDLLPSEYFDRNMYWTIVADGLSIKYRNDVGVGQIMWSSDFPHGTCDWPESMKVIERDFAGVPAEDRHKILAGNAARVYHLG